MDAPPRKDSRDRCEAYPEEAIRVSYGRITRACVCAGLSPMDADDVTQDIWMWMLRFGVPIAMVATPWLNAVVHNFVLRFQRRRYCRLVREVFQVAAAP